MTHDAYLKEQFIGQDPNYGKVGRDIFKSIKDMYKETLGYIPMKPMALLEATEKDSDVIKDISCSAPNDLLLDNFGVMLSSCINTGADVQRNVVDVNGITRTLHFQENGNINMAFATYSRPPPFFPGVDLSLGGLLRIGWGDSLGFPWSPNRTDYQLRQEFVVVPQTFFQTVSVPVWVEANQQATLFSQVNSVVANFNVGECGLYAYYRLGSGNSIVLIMLSHDQTGLAVSDGDNIKTTYTWSLS